jgi:hypothetical protein
MGLRQTQANEKSACILSEEGEKNRFAAEHGWNACLMKRHPERSEAPAFSCALNDMTSPRRQEMLRFRSA